MTNMANITRPNAVNGNQGNTYATKYATALKLFSGEVFNAFNSASIFKGLVRNYSLRGGKSKQFLLTGKLSAGYHTPGQPLLGDTALKANEKTILMDDLLVSSQFTYDLDDILSQYSTRSELSKQIGESLAKHYDVRIARVLDMASREASVVTGEPGGFEVSIGSGNQLNAQSIVDGFFEASSVLDERDAPQEGRSAVLSPRQYHSLVSSVDTNILNRDLGNTQGDLNSGKGLVSIAGIKIFKSNNLPFMAAYNSAVTGENNDYTDTNATCCGLIFHREAAGCLQSIAPTIETTSGDFNVQYQGKLTCPSI
tara:strand:+ start:243 stop:1175 length:933 start_codon:yes stop_codon:yes gene_type:complete